MPQMFPLNWVFMYFMFLLIFFMFNIVNFFFFMNFKNYKKSTPIKKMCILKINKKNYWKW